MKKKELIKLLEEDEFLRLTDDFSEAIYIIDNKMISGRSNDCGYRTVDHADLLVGNCTYDDLLHLGTVLVPETKSAIGKKHKILCHKYGYHMLPVKTGNHIMGY